MTRMSASIGVELVQRLYDGAWNTFAAVCLPRLWLARARGHRTAKIHGKFGFYETGPAGPRCWIHACSVGETSVALRCMTELRAVRPDLQFTLTTQTPEGHALAAARLARPDDVQWFPFDTRSAVRRAFDRIRPEFVILVEVELWPNHLRAAQERDVPVFVINARLTDREQRRYRLAAVLMRRAFAVPRLVCAQTADDAARFTALGAGRVVVAGNMKFDPLPAATGSPDAAAATTLRDRTVLLGASTHEGEEEVLLDVFQATKRKQTDLVLVLAPRHPQRAAKIAAMARRRGLGVSFASAPRAADCVVVDTIGELPGLYAHATLAFVGKSLTARGGQNFLEAVAGGCPVIFGPHMENFTEAADLFLAEDAVTQIADARALGESVAELLAAPERRAALAAKASSLLERHRGATRRTVERILADL